MVGETNFCEACGTQLNTECQISVQSPYLGMMSNFFASQAMLSMFTLLVLLGLVIALAPAGWRYASLQFRPVTGQYATTSDSRSLGTNNVPARCSQIMVIFNSTSNVGRISALLEQLDTTIAFGPNENGAFELSTTSASASRVAEALNRASDAVISASLQRRCF